jgi:tocopherol O-methyltransferase
MTTTAVAVARHYDELDPFYRDIWGEHVHHGLWRSWRDTPEQAVERLIDHVASALRVGAGDEVVDVGAGYGGTARYLAARYGVRVTGYTVSAAQQAFAQRNAVPGVEILLRDWHANERPDCSADAVLAIESTEHLADLPLALAEMRRVLKPGGRVAICAWLAAQEVPRWQRRALLEPIVREGRLATLATPSEYRRLLEAAGFAGVTFEDLSGAVARTWTVCLERLAWKLVSDARYSRYLLGSTSAERGFLGAMLRIRVAYACGAMRYGVFVARRAA